jgi:hypothetical protein
VAQDRQAMQGRPAVERARMPDRTVPQWDRDDYAYAGLVKFDLLGLGMLAALHDCFDLVTKHHGEHWATLEGSGKPAVRLGLAAVHNLGTAAAERAGAREPRHMDLTGDGHRGPSLGFTNQQHQLKGGRTFRRHRGSTRRAGHSLSCPGSDCRGRGWPGQRAREGRRRVRRS